MANIRVWLEDAVKEFGEPIEAMVVGTHDDHSYDEGYPLADENIVLSPEAGLAKVDQEYDFPVALQGVQGWTRQEQSPCRAI